MTFARVCPFPHRIDFRAYRGLQTEHRMPIYTHESGQPSQVHLMLTHSDPYNGSIKAAQDDDEKAAGDTEVTIGGLTETKRLALGLVHGETDRLLTARWAQKDGEGSFRTTFRETGWRESEFVPPTLFWLTPLQWVENLETHVSPLAILPDDFPPSGEASRREIQQGVILTNIYGQLLDHGTMDLTLTFYNEHNPYYPLHYVPLMLRAAQPLLALDERRVNPLEGIARVPLFSEGSPLFAAVTCPDPSNAYISKAHFRRVPLGRISMELFSIGEITEDGWENFSELPQVALIDSENWRDQIRDLGTLGVDGRQLDALQAILKNDRITPETE